MSPGCRDETAFVQQPEPAAVGWDVAKPGKREQEACLLCAFGDPSAGARAVWRRELGRI